MKEFDLIKLKFIILGLVSYLIMFGINKWFPLPSLENIFSTLGGLFLITGIIDIWLRKDYMNDLSKEIINGFHSDEASLEQMDNEHIKKSIINMSSYLAKGIKDPKIKQTFLDFSTNPKKNPIFGGGDASCYFTEYDAAIVIKKFTKQDDFAKASYKIEYTLINDSAEERKNNIFLKRIFPVNKDSGIDTQVLKSLEISIDGEAPVNYVEDIKSGKFKSGEENLSSENQTVSKDGVSVTRIKYNNQNMVVRFKHTLKVKKEIDIVTSKNDIVINHIFPRAARDASFVFVDENAKNIEVIKFMSFKEKDSVKIEKIQPNNRHVKFNDVILPRDGISFVLFR